MAIVACENGLNLPVIDDFSGDNGDVIETFTSELVVGQVAHLLLL